MAKPQYTGPWPKLRLQVLTEANGHCEINGPRCTKVATHVDHIIEVREGGAWWDRSNLRASCATCNIGRTNRKLTVASRQW